MGMQYFFYLSLKVIVIVFFLIFINIRKNLLTCLLAFEGIILFLGCILFFCRNFKDLFVLFILFTFGACEASLGLSCLIIMVRAFGNDNFSNISSIKC